MPSDPWRLTRGPRSWRANPFILAFTFSNVHTATYVGTELDLFAEARNWKNYLRHQIAPFIGSSVLEVGAGIGSTTAVLNTGEPAHWLGLEPDPGLAHRLSAAIEHGRLPTNCTTQVGTLADLDAHARFDTILYVDVLEHIGDDRGEVLRAATHLAPGGSLVVLSPAHPFLFTPFDEAIGHYRRYTRATLRALTPPGTSLVRLRYLDAVGLLASLGNRLVLQQSMPGREQVLFWDRVLVPLSRRLDPLLRYRIGKSVLAVWHYTG